jgi:hypothetical protein
VCYCEVWNQTGAELCTDLERKEPIRCRSILQRMKHLHCCVQAENVAEITATGSVELPGARG